MTAWRGDAERLYADGLNCEQVAVRVGVSPASVHHWLQHRGLTRSSADAQRRQFSDAEIATAIQAHRNGESVFHISRRMRTGHKALSRAIKQTGYQINARGAKPRERHHNWKGGRKKVGKYVHVLIESDDPMRCMANPRGYVAEHRLVMARQLGRPLREYEEVHHKDGVGDHNLIGNLQLRSTRHGAGVVARCAHCGSTDIDFVDLATAG